jgi:hypothetical protein
MFTIHEVESFIRYLQEVVAKYDAKFIVPTDFKEILPILEHTVTLFPLLTDPEKKIIAMESYLDTLLFSANIFRIKNEMEGHIKGICGTK